MKDEGFSDSLLRRRFPSIRSRLLWILFGLGICSLALVWHFYSATALLLADSPRLGEFRQAAMKTLIAILLLFLFAAGLQFAWISKWITRPLIRLKARAHDMTRPPRWNARFREAEALNQAFTEYVDAMRKLAEGLREEHDRLASVLNRLEEGIVLLSPEGRVLTANPAARKLLPSNSNAVDWEGRLLSEQIAHPGLRGFAADVGNPLRPPFYQVDRGTEIAFDLLCHLRPMGGAAGEYLLTVINVTDFRNLDRAKSDFVANASHELKTPLSSILGYAETLIDGALDNPHTREPFVRKIHDNALRLQRLVQDLLSLSQLESQTQPRNAEPLPVRSYVHAAAQLVRGDMESQGIRFENHVPTGLHFRMEPRDFELICNNLIGNAVRYNHPGGKVKVSWDSDAGYFSVKDTGVGIAEEMLPRIFERFYRADSSRARKDGTGLGLAIVKHAAQRYGMVVRAASRLGEGSEFSVEMPAELFTEAL